MRQRLHRVLLGFLIISFASSTVRAEPMKEFITSCTYGVLAGTLVGAASLAFTKKPGDNLNNIARGASLGLYAGILLGAYVVYMVPSGDEPVYEQGPAPEDVPSPEEDEQVRLKSVYPILTSDNKIDGVGVNLQILAF